MARTGRNKPSLRVLVWLGVILAAMTAVLAGGTDVRGCQLEPEACPGPGGRHPDDPAPKVEGGSDINEEQLNQAVAIIRQRVDGSGVAEAEISTQSGRNVVVSLPGTPSTQTRALIQASADMNFRPVLVTGAGAAVPAAQRTPAAQLPKPTAKPTNASDSNWITADVSEAVRSP
jgi:preprotein translocase subunit SecD